MPNWINCHCTCDFCGDVRPPRYINVQIWPGLSEKGRPLVNHLRRMLMERRMMMKILKDHLSETLVTPPLQIEKSRILNDRRHCFRSQSGVFLPTNYYNDYLNLLALSLAIVANPGQWPMWNRCEAMKQMLLSLDRPPKGPF